MVKVPGPSADRPNAYPFGTSYDHIYKDLAQKDSKLYVCRLARQCSSLSPSWQRLTHGANGTDRKWRI